MNQSWSRQMRKGLAEMCVLQIVGHGETYGYAILTRLKAVQSLSFSESTLYPVLARLTESGLLSVREAASGKGPNRRYYKITRAGSGRLEDLREEWNAIIRAVEDLTAKDEDRQDD